MSQYLEEPCSQSGLKSTMPMACSSRLEEVRLIEAYWPHADAGGSHRQFAALNGVSRSRVGYMVRRAQKVEGSELWKQFVETGYGLFTLHRIVLAALYVIVLRAGGGIRMVEEFLRLCGLDDVVASSYGTLQRRQKELEEMVIAFSEEQTEQLSAQMEEKAITLAEDETFHGGKPCLVAMDVMSNFILLEEYANDRKRETWTTRIEAATASMPVRIEQCVTDGARALKSHVEHDLGAHPSPDTFHIQQDLSKATARALEQRTSVASDALRKAEDALQRVQEQAQRAATEPRKPGRPIDFDKRIEAASQERDRAQDTLKQAIWDQESARDTRARISALYHLVDPVTGHSPAPDQLEAELTSCFDILDAIAERTGLRSSAVKLLAKTRKQIGAMVATFCFAWSMIRLDLDQLDLAPGLREHVEDQLVAACYLKQITSRAPDAETRHRLTKRAQELESEFEHNTPGWSALDGAERQRIKESVQRSVGIFQRSSSCVEGRNGVLALNRHAFHCLTKRRLAALTAVHNFAVQRDDGTTAANRFFELQHPDMFGWLLSKLPPPARPRKCRGSQPRMNAA